MNNMIKKKCPSCKELLPLSAFNNDRTKSYGKATWCKMCSKDRVTKARARAKLSFLEYKGGARCIKCGYDKYIGALDFHHVDPASKEIRIPDVTVLDDRMKAELDKCVVLCANCHREVEGRMNGK